MDGGTTIGGGATIGGGGEEPEMRTDVVTASVRPASSVTVSRTMTSPQAGATKFWPRQRRQRGRAAHQRPREAGEVGVGSRCRRPQPDRAAGLGTGRSRHDRDRPQRSGNGTRRVHHAGAAGRRRAVALRQLRVRAAQGTRQVGTVALPTTGNGVAVACRRSISPGARLPFTEAINAATPDTIGAAKLVPTLMFVTRSV